MSGEANEDSCDLCRSLAFSKNDFRHAGTQCAMVIDFSEAEIFKGQMSQTIDGLVGREFAVAYFVEELADGFSVQEALGSRQSDRAEVRLAFCRALGSGVGGTRERSGSWTQLGDHGGADFAG